MFRGLSAPGTGYVTWEFGVDAFPREAFLFWLAAWDCEWFLQEEELRKCDLEETIAQAEAHAFRRRGGIPS